MHIRICQKCGKHNLENAWSCADCGETLSLKTLVDATNTQLVAEISESLKMKSNLRKRRRRKSTTHNKSRGKIQHNKTLPFAVYVIYVIAALLTNWLFSALTAGAIVVGIEKMGGDVGAPAILLVVFLFINGILSIITAIIMGIAKVYKREFPAKFSILVFVFTYFPFHVIGLYMPDKLLGSLASPITSLTVYMLLFSYIPFFHMTAQGLTNMYEYIKKRKKITKA